MNLKVVQVCASLVCVSHCSVPQHSSPSDISYFSPALLALSETGHFSKAHLPCSFQANLPAPYCSSDWKRGWTWLVLYAGDMNSQKSQVQALWSLQPQHMGQQRQEGQPRVRTGRTGRLVWEKHGTLNMALWAWLEHACLCTEPELCVFLLKPVWGLECVCE